LMKGSISLALLCTRLANAGRIRVPQSTATLCATRRQLVLIGGAALGTGSAAGLRVPPAFARGSDGSDPGQWTAHTGPFDATYFKDFTETDTGIGYKKVRLGEGDKPVQGQKVYMHYTGYLLDGTKFDSSYDSGGTFAFRLGRGKVISGWEGAVAGMNKGMRVILRLPPKYAYGEKGAGSVIPPDATLVFYMELVALGSIKP